MKRDVIIFAGALFDGKLWTNRQQVAVRLAERGHRVLYVEPRHFWLTMLLGQFPGSKGRWSWLLRSHWPWRARKNLWVVSQINTIPWSRELAIVSNINHWLNAPVVRVIAKLKGFLQPALLVYDTEAAQYLSLFKRSRVIYDCVDDHRVQAGVNRNPLRVKAEEEKIAQRAGGISVTTDILYDRFRALNKNVRLVPNAADIDLFKHYAGEEPEDLRTIPHPRIGTVGALDPYKVDFNLLVTVAKKHADWQFILVGPENQIGGGEQEGGIRLLKNMANVHFLGEKPQADVPAYVHAFDVAMIPYRKSEYNNASFPLKFWEFMASGKPVVAMNLPSLRPYQNIFLSGQTVDDFERGVLIALSDGAEQKTARLGEAEKHGWDERVDALENMLE